MIPLRHTISAVIGASAAALIAALPALSMEPLSLDELDEVRAGFNVGGFNFASIGAELHAAVDGTTIATSRVTWDDGGVTLSRELHDVADIVPIEHAAALGLNIPNIEGSGVLVQGAGGATAIIQTADANKILNLAVNNANDRNIELNSQFTFVIPNLADLQQNMQMDKIRAGLDAAMSASLIGATLN